LKGDITILIGKNTFDGLWTLNEIEDENISFLMVPSFATNE